MLLAAGLLLACTSTSFPTQTAGRPTHSPGAIWTPPPSPTTSSPPTALPLRPTPIAIPTCAPTPTTAPLHYPEMQVGSFFFFWHDCPKHQCDSNLIYALPPGWNEPLAGDPDPLDGEHYSSRNRYWYLQELRDMRLAGIGLVFPISWGDTPSPWFRTDVLQNLVEANRYLDVPMRIGLFDDTSSEVREYGDYADNRLFDYSDYSDSGPHLDLRDPASGFYFYDRKIRPFFQTIPQEMWATHDGRPLEQGGRPIIIVYTSAGIIHLENAGALWASIKKSFQRDFYDRNGQPITPWLILESTWFTTAAMEGRTSLEEVVDGRYVWGAAMNGLQVRDWHDYTVTSVGPGFDDSKLRWPEEGRVQPRQHNPDGGTGDAGTFLRWCLEQIPPRTDLLLVETWNELWEGTFVCRATYPSIEGQTVPEDYYLNLLRRYLTGQDLWWAAQPLPPTWPSQWVAGQHYRLTLSVRNSGTRTWSAEGGERLVLGGDLFPEGQAIRPAGPVRPGEVGQFSIPVTMSAQMASLSLTWQMHGPTGAFGPLVDWPISVGAGAVTTTLYAQGPTAAIQVGDTFTLSLGLEPPLPLEEIRLRIRFDPATLYLIAIQPLPVHLSHHWQGEVDNERGLALLQTWANPSTATRQIAQLHLQARQAGQSGIWIEQVELELADGFALVLEAQWVPLSLQAAP